jgi:hypothetical protein
MILSARVTVVCMVAIVISSMSLPGVMWVISTIWGPPLQMVSCGLHLTPIVADQVPAVPMMPATRTATMAAMEIDLALPVATPVPAATSTTITAAPTTLAWQMLTAPLDQTVPPVSHLTLFIISAGTIIMSLALFSFHYFFPFPRSPHSDCSEA